MSAELNEKQRKILHLIDREVKEKGYPPSVREICQCMGFKSTSTAHTYLKRLHETGYLKKVPGTPRGLKVTQLDEEENNRSIEHTRTRHVPIIGNITAGQPVLAVENIEDYFPVPEDLCRDGNIFILKVTGESMIEAGIFDNDMVMVRQQNTAENGDIAVALMDGEATVKTFYKENGYIRLQPENKYMEPLIIKDTSSFTILGKVIGLYRSIR